MMDFLSGRILSGITVFLSFILLFPSVVLLAQPVGQPQDTPHRGPMPPTLLEERAGVQTPAPFFDAMDHVDYYDTYYPPAPPTPALSFEEMIEQQNMAYAQVLEALSGDTFRLHNGLQLRLIGVQAPRGRQAQEGEQYYGQEATEYARRMLRGRPVKLTFDQIKRQPDGTLLAYVFLTNGRLVNEEMLLEGMAVRDITLPLQEEMSERFAQAQSTAQRRKRGMWENPDAIGRIISTEPPPVAEEATPEEPVAPQQITRPIILPRVLPDQIILINGERLDGRIIGDREGEMITLETAEGNTIALPRSRISEIRSRE